MASAGLGDARHDGGPQRLTLTSPLAGLVPAFLDVPTLARSIEAVGRAVAGLPAKTLVLVEGGGATDLPGIAADLHVRVNASGRASLGLACDDGIAWIAACGEPRIAGSVAALLRAFAETGRRRIRDLGRAERAILARALPASILGAVEGGSPLPWGEGRGEGPDRPAEGMAGTHGDRATGGLRPVSCPSIDGILNVEAPFGRCTADMLEALAEAGLALGAEAIRVAPTRGFVLAVPDASDQARARSLADLAAAGFITTPDDPRRAVAACPGAPACGSGSTPTGADAARLADAFRPFAARGLTAHVSGCAKGCAHPGRAALTLVGRDGRYGIVLDGTPADTPRLELTFEAALERVWRVPGDLAQAFSLAQAFRPDISPLRTAP